MNLTISFSLVKAVEITIVPRKAQTHQIRDQLHVWLPTVFFEALLIVASILLALWLDEKKDDDELQELVNRSVISFERELSQNKRRVADVYPYHVGLHTVLKRMTAEGGGQRITEFSNIMNEFQVGVLFNSSWQTALATGALTRMDFELVSALSLTYSVQERFQDTYTANIIQLSNTTDLTAETIDSRIFVATRFVGEMTDAEGELDIYYQTVLDLIAEYKSVNDLVDESESRSADVK